MTTAPAVYGIWNQTTGDRIYTTSSAEVSTDTASGYTSLGVVFHGVTTTGSGYAPVFRLRSPQGKHLYTPYTGERDLLVANGWTLEGTPFSVSLKSRPGTVPEYRFYDMVKHAHYLSSSATVPSGSRSDNLIIWPAP